MKKAFALLGLLFASALAHAQTGLVNYFGDCSSGAGQAVTQGLQSSNFLRTNYPQCTVTVYAHGTQTKETIYADSNSTPLSNPFTANSNALYGFYMAPGQLIDITMSSSAFVTMPTTTISGIVSGEIALAGVQAINSVEGAFTFTGPGVSCAGTTCTFTGSGATTLQNDLVAKGSAGTFQDEYNFYADAGYTPQQAYTAAAANNGSFTIQPTAGRKPFVATGNVRAVDLRGDVPATAIGVTEKGAVCDTNHQLGSVTTGSNVWTIADGTLTTADIGKTVAEVGSVSGVPTAFESVITGITDSLHATLTSNSPMTAGIAETWYGHDDTTAITNTMAAVGSGTLVFPEGACLTHTQTLRGQSPIGLGPGSAIAGFPGEDIFAAPDPSVTQGINQGYAHIHDLTFYVHSGIDATQPWQLVNDSGTTQMAAMYRPVAERTGVSSDPRGPGWMQGRNNGGGYAGVGSINSSTPTHLAVGGVDSGGGYPLNGDVLVFPYLTTVFSTSVASGGGTANLVLANAYPGATNTQAEFIFGTSGQSLAQAVSSGTCPGQIFLSNSIFPQPDWESNFAPFGLIQIDGEQIAYTSHVNAGFNLQPWSGNLTYGINQMVTVSGVWYQSLQGNNFNHAPASSGSYWTVIPTPYVLYGISCAQNGTSRAAHSLNAPVVPLNNFKPAIPWPVTPTINSAQTTPVNASYYPGWNAGNAAFAFPVASGINPGTGAGGGWSANSKIENLSFFPIPGFDQEVNHTAMYYSSQPSYASSFENLLTLYLFYGVAEGGPSINTGNWATEQPTADGSHWKGLQLWAANPWIKAVGNQNSFEDFNMYSSEGNGAGGTYGADTCFYNVAIWNDQTGGVASGMSLDHYKNIYCEPEGGSHDGTMPSWEWDTDNSVIEDQHMGGGGEVYIGGAQQQWIGGNFNQTPSDPGINFGFQNTSVGSTLLGQGFRSNIYGAGTLINLGDESNFSGQVDNAFSNPSGPLGGVQVGGRVAFQNQTNETFNTGNLTAPYASSGGGLVLPDEFNRSYSFESNPMTAGPTFDDTAPISHQWIGCDVGTNGGNIYCFSSRFNEDAIYIGPDQRLVAGKYEVYAAIKDVTAATNSFNLIIGTQSGCAQNTIINRSVSITNQWPSTEAAMDLGEIDYGGGGAGCTLAIAVEGATSADRIQFAFLDFAPVQENIVAQNINATSINLLGGAGCGASPVTGLGKGFYCPAVGWSDVTYSDQGVSDTTLTISAPVAAQVSPTGGCFFFGQSEIECYTGVSGSTLTGIKRGQYTTTATTHATGSVVVGYSLILSPANQPSFDIAYGLNEQEVVGINNIYPFDHGGVSVLGINQGNNELWVNTAGAITQQNAFTFNQFNSAVGIGQAVRNHAVITDTGYLMYSNLAQTDYLPLGLGGGAAGSVNAIQPPTIAAPALQSTLGSGAATVSYVCSGTDFDGNLVPGTAATLTNVQATWSFPTSVTVICPYAAGINTYQIYRTVGGQNQGLLNSGVGPSSSFIDADYSATAGTPPATNTTTPTLRAWNLSLAGPGVPLGTCLMTGVNGGVIPVSPPAPCGSGGGGGGMVYPGVGVAVSAGGSWASSLAFGVGNNALLQLNNTGGIPAINASLATNLTAANITTGGVANIEIAGEEDVTFSSNPSFSIATRYSTISLTGSIASFTLPAGQPGQEKDLTFCQVSPGGYTVTPPTNVLGFGGVVPTTGACTTQHFVYKGASVAAWLADGPGTTSSATAAPAPTIAAGTGAGTSPTVSIVAGSTSDNGFFSVTTGSAPTASATVSTVTFGVPFAAAPRCQVWPANAATQALVGTAAAAVYPSGTSGTTFALVQGPTGLAAATAYEWGYKCSSATTGFTGGGGSGGGMIYPAGNGIAVVTGGSAWGTTLTAPSSAIVGVSDAQTLTNKVIASSEITGLPPFPSGTIVGTTDTQTVTNKTIVSPSISTTNLQLTSQGTSNVWHMVQAPTNVTAQSANISNTTVYTPTGGNAWYKICVIESVTRAATASSTLPNVQFFYTGANDSAIKNIFLGGNSNNATTTTATSCSGPFFATNAIFVYDTTGYASSGATTMQYDLQIEIETY